MLPKRSPVHIGFYAFMIAFVIVTVLPFYILLVGSFKTQQEINSAPLAFPGPVEVSPKTRFQYIVDQTPIEAADFIEHFNLEKRPAQHRKINEIAESPEQLQEMQDYIAGTLRFASPQLVMKRASLPQSLLTTMLTVFGSVAMLSLAGGMAAYSLTHTQYRSFGVVLLIFTAGLSLPLMLGMVPLYIMFTNLNLLDNPLGVICIYTGIRLPMTILVFLAFYSTIPRELEDASKVDGATRYGYFFRVLLPLSKAPILTTFVISGTYVFNDYMTPLVFMTDPVWTTVQVALARFVGAQTWFFGPIFAGVLLASLPMLVIYLLMNRTFIRGIVEGSVK